jgi:hypothetical protein
MCFCVNLDKCQASAACRELPLKASRLYEKKERECHIRSATARNRTLNFVSMVVSEFGFDNKPEPKS